jgi:hypothetical protein
MRLSFLSYSAAATACTPRIGEYRIKVNIFYKQPVKGGIRKVRINVARSI